MTTECAFKFNRWERAHLVWTACLMSITFKWNLYSLQHTEDSKVHAIDHAVGAFPFVSLSLATLKSAQRSAPRSVASRRRRDLAAELCALMALYSAYHCGCSDEGESIEVRSVFFARSSFSQWQADTRSSSARENFEPTIFSGSIYVAAIRARLQKTSACKLNSKKKRKRKKCSGNWIYFVFCSNMC